MKLMILALSLVLAPALSQAGTSAGDPPTYFQVRRAQQAAGRQAFRQVVTSARALGVPTRLRLASATTVQALTRVAAVAATAAGAAFAVKTLTTPGIPHDELTLMSAGFAGGLGPMSGFGLWSLGNYVKGRARGAILLDTERRGFALAPEVRAELVKSGYVILPTP